MFELVEQTLEKEPENGNLWVAFSNLYTQNYTFEFFPPITTALLETAENYACKGVEFEPENQSTHMTLAYVYLLQEALDLYDREVGYAYRLNPHNAYYSVIYGWCEILRGQSDAGINILREAVTLNSYYPSSLNSGFFLYTLCAPQLSQGLRRGRAYSLATPLF
jgi:Tfp pilus assembly protein PilF